MVSFVAVVVVVVVVVKTPIIAFNSAGHISRRKKKSVGVPSLFCLAVYEIEIDFHGKAPLGYSCMTTRSVRSVFVYLMLSSLE